ncbi:hypothetical protein [Paenibacillus ferrarius]|uniref:hypothetical protein n=1 Tax=Paenibacillus ferrarius TaxID=1469647 RepID=UPI003D2CDC34
MKENKPFTDPRWNDTSKPIIIGHIEREESERVVDKKQFREHLRKIRVLKKNNDK